MSLFLDHVTKPVNSNTIAPPFDLLVTNLWGQLEATNSENKGLFPTVSAKKVHIIETFIKTWRTHFGLNIDPAIKLTFPNRDGRKYFIKDVALVRLVSKLLNLQKGLADYTIIRNWKKSYHYKARLAGENERPGVSDLPLIISRIVLRRRDASSIVKSTVSVIEVNSVLDKLSETSHANDQVELLRPFIDKLTIAEVRYLFLIILKESMLSFFERSFFVAWHPDAYELYKVCNDIQKIFWALPDPLKRLTRDQLCVQLMYQFVPQSLKKLEVSYEALCQRMAAKIGRDGKDPKLLQDYDEQKIEDVFLIEEKVDGDRMLMHMNEEGKFLWHTRRRRDYSTVYGENFHIGSLTKHLGAAFNPAVKSIVLDGEMVAWSKDLNALLPFGTLRLAAIQEAIQQFNTVDVYEGNNSWPFFLIFDILHLNGKDLTHLPLFYRKNLLNKVVIPVPHRFELLRWVKASLPLDLKANMQQIVSENNEGIMVKSLLSNYRVHSRDSTWIKVKPEYLESFGENLDLVVIGKVGKVKTSYVCGLRDDEMEGCYKLFCSVANGFLNAVYRHIESKLCNYWVDYNDRKPPGELIQFGTKKPDFWIDPANLVVLEIKARSIEVTAETPYAAGSTLHNLWCRAVRDDKSYEECISLQEYQELKSRYSLDIHKSQAVNRNLKRMKEDSLYGIYQHKKRSKNPSVFGAGAGVSAIGGIGNGDNGKSKLFQNINFVIVNDYVTKDEEILQYEMEEIVRNHLGTTHLHPKKDELHGKIIVVISDRITPRIERWLHEGFDAIHPKWIVDCVLQKRLIAIEPQYVVASENPQLLPRLKRRTDKYGDSYSVCGASPAGFFRQLLGYRIEDSMPNEQINYQLKILSDAGIAPMCQMLNGCKIYIVGYSANPAGKPNTSGPLDPADSPDAAEACRVTRRIERYGGLNTEKLTDCSYVVVPCVQSARLLHCMTEAQSLEVKAIRKELAENFNENSRLPYIVHESFINASIDAKELADPGQHLV